MNRTTVVTQKGHLYLVTQTIKTSLLYRENNVKTTQHQYLWQTSAVRVCVCVCVWIVTKISYQSAYVSYRITCLHILGYTLLVLAFHTLTISESFAVCSSASFNVTSCSCYYQFQNNNKAQQQQKVMLWHEMIYECKLYYYPYLLFIIINNPLLFTDERD